MTRKPKAKAKGVTGHAPVTRRSRKDNGSPVSAEIPAPSYELTQDEVRDLLVERFDGTFGDGAHMARPTDFRRFMARVASRLGEFASQLKKPATAKGKQHEARQ